MLVYVVIGGLLSALVYQRFPNTGVALGCGFGAGLFVWFSIGYVAGLRARRAERRMIRQALVGGRPNDGEKIAVAGTIASPFDTLESPIGKQRCVAYEYKAIPAQAEEFAIVEGFALEPMVIDGPRGSIRILAVPELAFDDKTYTLLEHYQNFREYLERTQFREHQPIDFKREYQNFKTMLADDDGRIRYDIRRDANLDVNSLTLKEKVLMPGERVVAIGRYSAAKNALVYDPEAMLHSVKISKGDPSSVAQRERGKHFFESILGCGCLFPVIIAAILGLALVPLDAIEQQFATKDPSWIELKVERWLHRDVRPRLGSMIDKGEYAITLERGQARGKWNTDRLTRASARRDGDAIVVTLSTDAGKSIDIRVENGRVTNIPDADLETWAADEDSCNGRITALTDPRLHVMFRAPIRSAEGRAPRAETTTLALLPSALCPLPSCSGGAP
jgi:hypothetical protein